MNTRKTKKIVFNFFRIIILAMFLLFAVLPLFWIFITSLKSNEELYALPIIYWPNSEFCGIQALVYIQQF